MAEPKTEPKKQQEVLVVDPQFEPIENYPSTPTIAQRNFQEYLEKRFSEGWQYHGEISQTVGAEKNRPYWVFYRVK